MSFASFDFVVFFPTVLLVVLLLQKKHPYLKELFLLVASYFFYGYWDWRFCFLLLLVTICSFFSAKYIHKKGSAALGIVFPLVVLGLFKYFNFFLDSFAAMVGKDIRTLKIILPVGISFYTFQALSYVIDVKRGKIESEKSFSRLALYISFFPQLVAGPIVKAADFLPQLKEDRRISLRNLETGLQFIVFGLFKKIVLADHLSVFVDDVFSYPAAFHWCSIILAVISYSIQIYFDFSGYSDIAVGCAKCLGYDFLPNFNLPYVSENVTVFWKRWHISLSSWLKEYLYIPLGGNRKGRVRQYINLLITMLLGGLWHGANWTYVFWGALHGVALCVDKIRPKKKETHFISRLLNILGTFLFVSFSWIFFRADDFSTAWLLINGIFCFQDGIWQPFAWSFVAIGVLTVSTIAAMFHSKRSNQREITGFVPMLNLNTLAGLALFFFICGLIICLAFTGESPFVYFQF